MDRRASLVPSPTVAIAPLEDLVEIATEYALHARANSTRRTYERDFRTFEAWCRVRGLASLPCPPPVVALYIGELAKVRGFRPATIDRILVGIAHAHRSRGHSWDTRSPAIAEVRAGIRRELGVAPEQKAPISDAELGRMVATLGGDAPGIRDRALLTLGWCGAFRRSELVALNVADVVRQAEGLVIRVRRSKTDQEGQGASKGIPYAATSALCPVRALEAWLEVAKISAGPLFRRIDRHGKIHAEALSDRSVARIVQRVAGAIGLDPARVAGHSLRSGFVTTASRKGKSLDSIMRQTLHRDQRVALSYIRHAQVFDDNAAKGIV
jgi:integrase